LQKKNDPADSPFNILADWKAAMAKKSRNPNFDQMLDTLRARSFDVAHSTEVAGGTQISKYGAAAVLVPVKDAPAAFAVSPGALVRGEVARLIDRGYQKFIKTSQFEIPASASQLHSIHMFSEELKQLTGATDLYNQALGTTSDAALPAPVRPWELSGGH
jgi:hypothetical protein